MLNKNICKLCYQNAGSDWDEVPVLFGNKIFGDKIVLGSASLEDTWNSYHHICCRILGMEFWSIKGKPPEECPYYFEHILENGK